MLFRESTCSGYQKHVEIKENFQLYLPLREIDRIKKGYVVPLVYSDNVGITSCLPAFFFSSSLSFSHSDYSVCENWEKMGEKKKKKIPHHIPEYLLK